MTYFREWCWLRTLWTSAWSFLCTGNSIPISGHSYVLAERHENCTVEILRCRCGNESLGWWPVESAKTVENAFVAVAGTSEPTP